MAEYWLKTDAQAEPQGPYRGSDLKSYAAAGQIEPDWLVSPDQQKWVAAKRVSGLVFPTSATTPEPAPLSEQPFDPMSTGALEEAAAYEPATYDAPTYDATGGYSGPPALPTPALSYAVPRGVGAAGAGAVGKRRDIRWLIYTAIGVGVVRFVTTMMLWGTIISMAVAAAKNPNRQPAFGAAATTGFGAATLIANLAGWATLGVFIYVLVWVFKIHEEMRIFTVNTYPISPGKALGFCFIPFYNLYWFVAMPGKLADVLKAQLAGNPDAPNPSTVRVLQFLAILPGACIPGVQLLLVAISLNQLQRGLNTLWVTSGRPLG